jgi:hypothetical protein
MELTSKWSILCSLSLFGINQQWDCSNGYNIVEGESTIEDKIFM